MIRRLLILLTALSLLLCVVVAAATVRSVGWHDSWRRYVLDRPRWLYGEDEVVVHPGVLRYRWFRAEVFDESFARHYEDQPLLLAWQHSWWPNAMPAKRLDRVVPRYDVEQRAGPGAGRGTLSVPFLPPLVVSAVLPALWLRRVARRRRECRRAGRGLCLSCGYDLTGNASGVCPECGAAARLRPSS